MQFALKESEGEKKVHYPDSAPSGWPDDSGGDLTHAPNRPRQTRRADFGDKPLPTRFP
jgi:hypothetical protein